MTRLVVLALTTLVGVGCTLVGVGCSETIVKTLPGPEAGAPAQHSEAGTPVLVNPAIDAGVDSGVVGRRLNDLGCQTADDCDSNYCFVGAIESFCTRDCTPSTAATDCPKPLAGTCSRQFYCDRAE